ncbi:FAD-binding oxidoreductase [Actinoallomurus sp. CA-150999]|uniref:FAD-binding oxidoreductase n=1 Tax=Actinoallomurus sp. CA-150999 TaxID=3239887 RepID=UPI003D8D3D12
MRDRLEDALTWRDDARYPDLWASMLWNDLKPQRFPDVIVRAGSAAIVREAVGLARDRGLRIAVRGSGHSWCGSPLRDGGMLIDLSGLRRHTVDPGSATAVAEPGVTGRTLSLALAEHGLAFPTGHCPTVALSGFLLSGGLGWNPGVWGPACHSVQGIEAVTADGALLRCDEEQNADLFWAARGAGPGFFAAVTSFRLGLHPLPAAIMRTRYVFPLAEVEGIARWADEIAAELPASVEFGMALTPAEAPEAGRPPTAAVTAIAFAGSRDEAVRALGPLRDCPLAGRALVREVDEPTTFESLYADSAAFWPERHRAAVDTLWSRENFRILLPRIAGHIERAPSDKSLVLVLLSPGGPEAPATPDTAFAALGRTYLVPYAIWADRSEDEANLRWLRQAMEAVEPLGVGHYVAETDLPAAPSRARRSFTPAAWERLAAVRAAYDPGGVFQTYLTTT